MGLGVIALIVAAAILVAVYASCCVSADCADQEEKLHGMDGRRS